MLQPDVGRVGGFTEALRVCRIAADRGRAIVPHCWKSGLGIAAAAHLAAATEHCPYIEFLPIELAESPLRRELLVEDLRVVDGQLELPTKPGLGIELNRDALRKYRVDDRQLTNGSHLSSPPDYSGPTAGRAMPRRSPRPRRSVAPAGPVAGMSRRSDAAPPVGRPGDAGRKPDGMGASPIPAATDAESGRVRVNSVRSLVAERHGPFRATRFRIARTLP